MSCESCTSSPVRGQASLPAVGAAYLTANSPEKSSGVTIEPAVKVVTDYEGSKSTAYSYGCPTTESSTCAPTLSTSSIVTKYCPGWLQKLTGAAKGRLLIGVGKYLHYFQPENKGPVYYDGENVTVEQPEVLTQTAGESSVIENGFLTLAAKTKQSSIVDGEIEETEFYEHGVQQVRDVGVGELMGLTRDCVTDAVRIDAIQPEVVNLVTGGWKSGLKRLGYAIKEISNGCYKQDVKEWFAFSGAIWEDSEIAQTGGVAGVPAVLVERKGPNGEKLFVLARNGESAGAESGYVFTAPTGEVADESSIESAYSTVTGTVRVQWFDEDGDFRTSYRLPDGTWYHPAEKLLQTNTAAFTRIEEITGASAKTEDQFEIDPTAHGVPEDAKFVKVYASTYITTDSSAAIMFARQVFGDANAADDGGDGFTYPHLIASSSNGGASQPDPLLQSNVVGWVPLNADGNLDAYWRAELAVTGGTGTANYVAAITGWRR